MDRRESLAALAALCLPAATRGQPAAKVPRIGYLASDLARGPPLAESFRKGLRDLGYVEGRSIVIEYRDAAGDLDRLPSRAADLVALNVDVIFAPATAHVVAAKQATATIPIVFADVGDPVALGFAQSLARPGGNMTGLSNFNPELLGKWLQLLKQAVPAMRDVAFVYQPGAVNESYERDFLAKMDAAARSVPVRLRLVQLRSADDFDKGYADMARERVGGVIVWGGSLFIVSRQRLVDLAARHGLPSMYSMGAFVDAGGLMSYSTNIGDNFRRAARYVDRILKGARPSDLPIEQPTTFELVINQRAAKALGMTMPPALIHQANKVIE